MGKNNDPLNIDDNRPELSINDSLFKELESLTSRGNLMARSKPVISPEQVRQQTGGVDFDRVAEGIGNNINIFHDDTQDKLGEQQSAVDKWANFGVQLAGEIVGGTVEGTGYLGDAAGTASILRGDMNEFGNWFSDLGIAIKEGSKENFPIFGAHNGGSLGWWLENGVSVASSLSLLIPAVGTVRGLGMLGKAVGIGAKLGKGAKYGQLGKSMTVLGQAFTSRHMENMMEASGVWDQTRQAAFDAGKTLDEANNIASKAASDLYKVNYTLLGQDILQYALLARGPKINADITSRRLASALGQSANKATLKAAYTQALTMGSEGIEEGLQFIFAEEAKYNALHDAKILKKEELSDRLKSYADSGDMWTNILFGALGAGVMQGGRNLTKKYTKSGKAEQAQLEARIELAQNMYKNTTAAAMQLQAATQSGNKEAIKKAEEQMVFNSTYNSLELGLFDAHIATMDDLIASDQEKAEAEPTNFSPDFKKKLTGMKAEMQDIGKLYTRNAKKYSPGTVKAITQLQYANKKFNDSLPEIRSRELNEKAKYPLYNNLSSEGLQLFEAQVERLGLERAIKTQLSYANSPNPDGSKKNNIEVVRALARAKKFGEKLDKVNKNIKAIEESQQKEVKEESKDSDNLGTAAARIQSDREILEGISENTDEVSRAIAERLWTEESIKENNEDLKEATSSEGQIQYNKFEEDKIKKAKEAAKEEKKKLKEDKQKLKDLKKEEDLEKSVVNSSQGTQEEEDEAIQNQGAQEKYSSVKNWSDDKIKKEIKNPNQEQKVKDILQKVLDSRQETRKKEKEKKKDTTVSKGAELVNSIASGQVEVPSNDDQAETNDKKIKDANNSGLIAETGHAIAWKTTTGLSIVELAEEIQDRDKSNAKALSAFLEDSSIDKTKFKLEFFIDKTTLKNSENAEEGQQEELKSLYNKLIAREDISDEEIGVLPVRAYIINEKGERVRSTSGKDITAAIHDTTFSRWNELSDEQREHAITETIQLKKRILEASIGNKRATSDITEVRNGHIMNEDKGNVLAKNNVGTVTQIDPSNMTVVMGDAAPTGSSSRYVSKPAGKNGKIEESEELDGYTSATPGAIYVIVKTANGSSFPLRTFIETLTDQEANLVYELYKKTLENASSYKENLGQKQHADLRNFIKNSDDPRVSELLNFINLNKITIQDLLKVLVYEGSQTKGTSGRLMTNEKGLFSVGNVTMDKATFLTPRGKEKAIENLMLKRKQVSIDLISNPAYVSYLVNNEIITTSATSINGVMFRHPTTVFGPVEIAEKKEEADEENDLATTDTTTEVALTSETVTDGKGRTFTYFENTETKDGITKTTYTFNRSDKDSSQRNVAKVKPEIALANKGYEVTEDSIPDGVKINKVSEVRIDKNNPNKLAADVEFIAEDGKTFTGGVLLKRTQQATTDTTTEQKSTQQRIEDANPQLTYEEYLEKNNKETERFLSDKGTKQQSLDSFIEEESKNPNASKADIETLKFIKQFFTGTIHYHEDFTYDVPHPNVDPGQRWGGTFNSGSNSIFIFDKSSFNSEFIIHEALHGMVQSKLESFQGEEKDFDPVFSKEITRLFEYTKQYLNEDEHYGLKDIHEFVSEAFSNPEFRQELGKLEDAGRPQSNVFSSFIQAIKDFFLSESNQDIETSVLESILKATNIAVDPNFSTTNDTTTEEVNVGKMLIDSIKLNTLSNGIKIGKNPDGTQASYYTDKDNNSYSRVTSFTSPVNEEDKDKPLLKSSTNIGTKLDNMLRDFFAEGSTLSSKDVFSQPVGELNYGLGDPKIVADFLDQMERIKEHFKKTGETVVSSDVVLHSDAFNTAGTIDLITYDKQGNIRIYDIKSMRGNKLKDSYPNDVVKYESTRYGKSDKQKHVDQLSMYNLLLEDTYGVQAVELGILPVEVMYPNDEQVHTETSVLNLVDPGNSNGNPFITVKYDSNVFTRVASETSYDDVEEKEEDLAASDQSALDSLMDEFEVEEDDIDVGKGPASDVGKLVTNDGAEVGRNKDELPDSMKQDGTSLEDVLGMLDKPKPISSAQPAQYPAGINSTIYENNPDLTDENIETLYNNYKKLMNSKREGKAVSQEAFKSLLKSYQVFNYKDTYIFGTYDQKTATFVTRMNSSPTARQLLAEAIPALGNFGVDVISLVPKDYADKLERSGYTVSKQGFSYNFKGEKMIKYAAVSNPSVLDKIFNKNADTVTGKDLLAFDEGLKLGYTAVEIDAASVKAANGNLTATLETYLNSFGIAVKDISEMQEALDIDTAGFADILSKVAFIKDKENLPEVAGEFIAHMMQYNPLVKQILKEMPKVKNYEELSKTQRQTLKREQLKKVGDLISKELKNKAKGKKSLLEKISALIDRFMAILSRTDISLINKNIGEITNNVLQQNKKLITASKFKPGEFGKPVSQVSVDAAMAKDKFGASIIEVLSESGFLLTGSTALSEQGTILRPEENPLHDIDWVSPFSRQETVSKFLKIYPEAQKVRDIVNEDYTTDTYLIVPEGHKLKNYKTVTFVDSKGQEKILIDSYEVAKDNKVVGTYKLTADKDGKNQEVVTGVEGKAIDFFSYPVYIEGLKYPGLKTTTQGGKTLGLSNWKNIFNAKLEYSRYKDIWDYNRFIPNENVDSFRSTTTGFETKKGITTVLNKPKPTKPTENRITQKEIDEVARMVPANVATEVVKDYIKLLEGGRAVVGAFQSGLLQISKKARSGDGYHEAFHAVFRTMLSKQERQNILQEARDMFMPLESDIVRLMAQHKISNEKATELFYEEQLADEFAVYAANERAYDFNKNKGRQNYFTRLMSWSKDISGVTGNMERIFKDLKQGNFNKANNVDLFIQSELIKLIDDKTGKPC